MKVVRKVTCGNCGGYRARRQERTVVSDLGIGELKSEWRTNPECEDYQPIPS